MRKTFSVTRLEDVAFTACFREILSNLLLCPDHRPDERRNLNSYSSLVSLNPFLTSSNVRNFVRNRLNQHLIGIMNDDIRKKLVCEFNRNFYDSDHKSDIWVFLDCVLDASFVELDTHLVFPKTEPNGKVIQVIGYRSPNIETLKLNFEMVMKKTPLEKLKPIVISLNVLTNLTSLSLYCLNKQHKAILNYVGHSCPKLEHFCVTGFRIVKKDLLAFILGDTLDLFPGKDVILEEESDIHKFQVLPQYLAPLCSSLQHLQLEDLEEKKKLRKSCEYSGLSYSAVAFAIRHLTSLRRIDHSSSSVSSAVKLLNQNLKEIYEETDDINRSLRLPQSMTTNKPFSGVLSLTSLDFVNIRSVEMIKAVGRLCPVLKEVTFSELLHTDGITPEQLFEILTTEWPKVERVTFIKVSANYRKSVLSGIGAQLSNLTFVSCESIDIADLAPCTQLEVLRILFSSTLLLQNEHPIEKFSSHDIFLPKLSHLESDICLHERYSHLFEEKCSMTHLELECCHTDTKASSMTWNDMAKCWQRIQVLRIRQCSGLTIAMIKTLSLQLTKLKELSLPSGMLNSKDERELSYELMDYFNKSPHKIRLKFELRQSSSDCLYQAQRCPYETSDEEISSDSDESSQPNGRNDDIDYNVNHDWVEDIDVFEDQSVDDFYDEDEDLDGDSFDADEW